MSRHCTYRPTYRRRAARPAGGFTLMELLVTISIIAILAAIILAAVQMARETARVARTKATIVKLHKVVMARYDSYRTRRVPLPIPPGTNPAAAAGIRLAALRDLMRMEMPERWSDVAQGPGTGVPRPALSEAYRRRYTATPPSGVYDNAECLYLLVSMSGADARKRFRDDEIGDADGDGWHEFVDAWGNPIQFFRWAPGFTESDVQQQAFFPNPPGSITYARNQTVAETAAGEDHDPFDHRRLYNYAYRLVPLIYSAGPDGIYDLGVETNYRFAGTNPAGTANGMLDPFFFRFNGNPAPMGQECRSTVRSTSRLRIPLPRPTAPWTTSTTSTTTVSRRISMSASHRHNTLRRGFTLIELLVVVVIIVILLGIAIPRMRPAMENRRTREGARAMSVLFNQARTRAMESGLPTGVLVERFDQQAEASLILREVQVPPPYAGDFENSRIRITPAGGATATVVFTMGEDPVTDGLVQKGDSLRLNYQGHRWRIELIAGTTWTFSSTTASSVPATSAAGMPFQIYRQPMPTSTDPVRLPRQVVVDLSASGIDGPLPAVFGAAGRIMVMFSASGPVSEVHYGGASQRVTEPIYFLVGKWERMALAPGGTPQAEDRLPNWRDANNLWVALNPQTGLVTVSELHADLAPGAAGNPTRTTYVPADLHAARRFAREAQVSKGGR